MAHPRQKTLAQFTQKQLDFMRFWSEMGFVREKKKEAMLKAGYSPQTAAGIPSKSMRRQLEIAMRRQGMTPYYLAKKHMQKLRCRHPAHPEMPDNASQLKALEMAYEFWDVMPAKKVDIHQETRSVSLEMKTIEQIKRVTGEDITQAQEPIYAITAERAEDTI